MKKKEAAEPVVSPEIMAMAKRSIEQERPPTMKQCAVCGGPSTAPTGPQASDNLCWVCRRLKISAWREADQQISAQE